jgi:hypothetical protein
MSPRPALLVLLLVAATGVAGCSAADSRPTAASTGAANLPRLDGTYRRSVTAKAAADDEGVPVSDATPENYGDFVLVIRGARFAFTQSNAKACTWQYGALRIAGDHVEWRFSDGGGRAPTNAQNKPGEHFVWTATLFRGVLTLQPITPADLTTESWRRTNARPTIDALDHRCRPPAAALPG